MQWEFIVVLVLMIPLISFPAFLLYLDISGRYAAIRGERKTRVTGEERSEVEQYIASTVAKEKRIEREIIGTKS